MCQIVAVTVLDVPHVLCVGVQDVNICSLAKRLEEVFVPGRSASEFPPPPERIWLIQDSHGQNLALTCRASLAMTVLDVPDCGRDCLR